MQELTKIGLMPGTIMYTGKNNVRQAGITVIYYNKEEYYKEHFNSVNDFKINDEFNGNIWINIESISDIEAVKKIGTKYEINSLSLEDIVNPEQRVKIEKKDNYLEIIIKMLSLDDENSNINYEQLSIILKNNILITFQETLEDIFENIRKRIESRKTNINNRDISYLAYLLIDEIVDHYLQILVYIEDIIDGLEEKILNNTSKEDLNNILLLKQNMNILKKFISPAREIINKMQSRDYIEYFNKDMKYYLSDLNDHMITSVDSINILNSRVGELIQLYHSMMSNNMNEIMKTLAIISTIFMPLSFICGLYGMNFMYMPELKWKYGYLYALFIMVLMICIMLKYFRNKKWF